MLWQAEFLAAITLVLSTDPSEIQNADLVQHKRLLSKTFKKPNIPDVWLAVLYMPSHYIYIYSIYIYIYIYSIYIYIYIYMVTLYFRVS